MLIPSWFLVVEVSLLTIILVVVAYRHRHQTDGVIALALVFPMLYYIYVYIASYYVTIEHARELARAGQALQWMVMIFIFGRLLKRHDGD